MAGPILNSCCKFNSLATGSIVSGIFGIVLAIASLIVLFTVRVDFRTIVFDWFPQYVVKIILAINLCMTIFISILLIVGVVKVDFIFICSGIHDRRIRSHWNNFEGNDTDCECRTRIIKLRTVQPNPDLSLIKLHL